MPRASSRRPRRGAGGPGARGATFELAQGYTLEEVKQLLGHSSIVLTSNTYGHVVEQRQREVARGMDAVLGRVRRDAQLKAGPGPDRRALLRGRGPEGEASLRLGRLNSGFLTGEASGDSLKSARYGM